MERLLYDSCAKSQKLVAENNGWRGSRREDLYGAMGLTHEEVENFLNNAVLLDPVSNDLLSHVKLYIFAEMYGILELKDLSLHNFKRDLGAFTFVIDDLTELVQLFRYIYKNTMGASDDGSEHDDGLRELIQSYAAYHAERFLTCPEFEILLREGGEIALDFMKAAVKRLDLVV